MHSGKDGSLPRELDQKGAEFIPVSSVLLGIGDRLGSRGSRHGSSGRGGIGVAGQGTRDSQFSIKVGAGLGNYFFLDVNFPVDVFGKGMIVG